MAMLRIQPRGVGSSLYVDSTNIVLNGNKLKILGGETSTGVTPGGYSTLTEAIELPPEETDRLSSILEKLILKETGAI